MLLYQIWRVSLRCGNILTYPSASQVVSDVWSLCVSKRNLWSHCHCVGQSRWRARRHCQLPLCSRRDSEQLWSRQHRWCVSPSVWFSSFFLPPMICSSVSLFARVQIHSCRVSVLFTEKHIQMKSVTTGAWKDASSTFMQRSQVSNWNNSMKIHKCSKTSSYLWF